MNKQVGIFKCNVSDPWPIFIEIEDDRGNKIVFNGEHMDDLEYLISQIRVETWRRTAR